ncbi:MAG: CpsB/CapC family capsule biosynthesis tyrosine phosphatase [Thermomicrobium sp.]|nr:CpsB/CapC family capsule biosynthesis tyrosine phosphatase [Thermomicrobium sp.]
MEQVPQVDIHTHVLPGLDDGARDEREALAMLRIAVEDGTSVLVATPHARRCTAAAARTTADRLRELLAREAIPLALLVGMEEQLLPDLPERLARGDALSLGDTPWLLVELPDWTIWPEDLVERLRAIRALGFWPILAHVERYVPVQQRPERVLEAIEAGALVQVNADSLFGHHGPAAQRVAALLIRARAVSVLASDAHKPDHRAPRLRAAFERVSRLAGEDVAEELRRTAQAIVSGALVHPPQPDPALLQTSPTLLERLRSWVGV